MSRWCERDEKNPRERGLAGRIVSGPAPKCGSGFHRNMNAAKASGQTVANASSLRIAGTMYVPRSEPSCTTSADFE